MLTTVKGIVLHHFKYAEKSIIAKVYTNRFGLQSYIINGVRSAKAKNKAVYLQPLSLVEINSSYKEKKGLQQARNIQLIHPYSSIPFNISKSSMAFFLAEILYKAIKEEESNSDLFNFLFHAFQHLDLMEKNYHNFHLIFMGKLCYYMGIQPHQINENHNYFDLQEGCFTSTQPFHKAFIDHPYSNHLATVLTADFDENNLSLNRDERTRLLSVFIDYFNLHLSNFDNLKSIGILKEVLD